MKLSDLPAESAPVAATSQDTPPASQGTSVELPLQQKLSAAGTPPKEAPAPQMSRMDRVGTGMLDPVVGTGQLAAHVGLGAVDYSVDGANAVSRLFGGPEIPHPDTGALRKKVDTAVEDREKRITKESPQGFDAYRLAGNILSPINAVPLGRAASLGGRLARAAGAGAIGGVTQPTAGGEDFAGQKVKQATLGSLLGAGAGATSEVVGKLAGPQLSAAVKKLTDAGVTLTPGQLLQGIVKHAEDLATSFPGVRLAIEHGQIKSLESFNTAMINKALEPAGLKMPSSVKPGRSAIDWADRTLSDKYDKVLRTVTFTADPTLGQDAAAIATRIKKEMPEALQKQWQANLDDAISRLDPNDQMDGRTFKQVDSELGFTARNHLKSPNPADRAFGEAVNDLRGAMRDALERGNPAQAVELNGLNSAWAGFTRVQGASIRRVSSQGVFSPADLLSDIKRQSSRGVFARGDGLLQDLADAAQGVLPSSVPDSGTAVRSMVHGISAGGAGGAAALGHPGLAAGALGAAAAYTRPGMRVIQKGVTGGNQAVRGAARQTIQGVGTPIAAAIGGVEGGRSGAKKPVSREAKFEQEFHALAKKHGKSDE